MIDQTTFARWQEWSKRDDAWKLFVPSDIREMLGEIARLEAQQAREGWQLVPVEPTEAMLEAALDESGWRVEPKIAKRECGVPIECDMSEEDACEINEAGRGAHGDTYRSMLAAAPPPPAKGETS